MIGEMTAVGGSIGISVTGVIPVNSITDVHTVVDGDMVILIAGNASLSLGVTEVILWLSEAEAVQQRKEMVANKIHLL